MWKKDERSGKTVRDAGLYTLEKAAGGAMPDALPEEATLNPTGRRLAWKQERAGISPRRSLWNFLNLDPGKKVTISSILGRRFKHLLHQGPCPRATLPERLMHSPTLPPNLSTAACRLAH